MINWRIPFADLRREIHLAKKSGKTQVDLIDLEFSINQLEANILIDHEQDVLEEINETTLNKTHKQYMEQLNAYIKYVKEINEQHRLYTQLIITSGYAAYFGIWSLLKEHSKLNDISILLVIISAISFITLEIAKVGIEGWDIHIKNDALIKAKVEDDILRKQGLIFEADKYNTYRELWMSKIWSITYPISAITGLGGLALMLWSLLISLNI